MAARIVSLDRPRAAPEGARRALAKHAPERGSPRPAGHTPANHVWRGASGRGYAHSVYGLIECPPLPMASYVLVRRDAHGQAHPLRIGVCRSEAPTLNLAQVRQQAALAGASEVHVHVDAASDAERRLVACDLRAGLFGTLAATGHTER